MSFYEATNIPVLDFWYHLLRASKPEWISLFRTGGAVHDVHSLRFTSDGTPADLLMASRAAGRLPQMRV